MRALRRSACGLLAVLLTACAATVQGPRASQPPPTPSPTPAWGTFTSDRYGYSVAIPSGWEVLERAGTLLLPGTRPRHPGTDTISTPEGHRADSRDGIVVIGARELEAGQSLEAWAEEASGATPCGLPFGYDTTTLGGEPADFRKFDCGNVFWAQITAVHGDHGYMVWLVSTERPRADRRPINEQLLASFRFTDSP
ncbi:MAG: hypothetical protein ACT4OQ_03380 [Chloroflexota bacterium]